MISMDRADTTRKLVISVHIPKTGGTSLWVQIKEGKFGRFILDVDDRPMLDGVTYSIARFVSQLKTRVRRRELLDSTGAVHGHFFVRKYAFLHPEALFLTFMREPVSRLLSHYYYFKHVASKNPDAVRKNPLISLVAQDQMDLVEFARLRCMTHIYERFTRGLPLEDFALIGITERYAESVKLINHVLGTDIAFKHERRDDHSRFASEYEHVLPEIQSANRDNDRIYRSALGLFEKRLNDSSMR